MALINCKECGKEISDTVKKCPHCGYRNEQLKKEAKDKMKSYIKKYKKIITITIIVVVIGMAGIIGVSVHNQQMAKKAEIEANTLSEDEKTVAKIVKKYQGALKNPESMQIFEIRKYSSFVLMDTSGQNGFGGTTRDIVSYSIDGTYMGNDSKANNNITKYTSKEDKVEIVLAQAIRKNWKNTKDYIVINKDKILRNLEQVN